VWFPAAMGLVWTWACGRMRGLARAQAGYGISLSAVFILSCHVSPLTCGVGSVKSAPVDPRWDVTNDMYGWRHLPSLMKGMEERDVLGVPVVGSRYQTAAQAAFALHGEFEVSKLPLEAKE